jgi:hypothetical protein
LVGGAALEHTVLTIDTGSVTIKGTDIVLGGRPSHTFMTLEAVGSRGTRLAATLAKSTITSGSVSEVSRGTSLKSFVGKSSTSVVGQVVTSEALLASTDGGLTFFTVGDGTSLTLVTRSSEVSVVSLTALAVDRGISAHGARVSIHAHLAALRAVGTGLIGFIPESTCVTASSDTGLHLSL